MAAAADAGRKRYRLAVVVVERLRQEAPELARYLSKPTRIGGSLQRCSDVFATLCDVDDDLGELKDDWLKCRVGVDMQLRRVRTLRDRLGDLGEGLPLAGRSPRPGPGEDGPLADAISALVALGYKPPDANRMARAADDGAKTSEEIIRAALRAVSAP